MTKYFRLTMFLNPRTKQTRARFFRDFVFCHFSISYLKHLSKPFWISWITNLFVPKFLTLTLLILEFFILKIFMLKDNFLMCLTGRRIEWDRDRFRECLSKRRCRCSKWSRHFLIFGIKTLFWSHSICDIEPNTNTTDFHGKWWLKLYVITMTHS